MEDSSQANDAPRGSQKQRNIDEESDEESEVEQQKNPNVQVKISSLKVSEIKKIIVANEGSYNSSHKRPQLIEILEELIGSQWISLQEEEQNDTPEGGYMKTYHLNSWMGRRI